jgi:phage gp36-like protein
MNFITKDYIRQMIDNETLSVITEGNDLNLNSVENDAISEITGYLNVRYDMNAILTATTKSVLILGFVRDIMIYHLHAKVSPDNIPQLRVDRYNKVMNELEKIADGFTNPILPKKENGKQLPLRYGSSIQKTDHYY